jgi:hypothetical protein
MGVAVDGISDHDRCYQLITHCTNGSADYPGCRPGRQ